MQFSVQIGLKMETGDCPPLNINAMCAISVKSYLKLLVHVNKDMMCNAKIHTGNHLEFLWTRFEVHSEKNRVPKQHP